MELSAAHPSDGLVVGRRQLVLRGRVLNLGRLALVELWFAAEPSSVLLILTVDDEAENRNWIQANVLDERFR